MVQLGAYLVGMTTSFTSSMIRFRCSVAMINLGS